ncbi:MAG TPA: glycine zipper 2TM domain-containing protein [Xanthomonadales bacterium]|nr:glycine zipper 2TM domain-containing protein [Xanthomonadales bacterium]
MSKQYLIGGIIGAVAITAVGAVAGYRMMDSDNYADVVAVTAITKTRTIPHEECHDQMVEVATPVKDPKQITGTVAGAVIGGVLGNQVGGGSGKKVATVAGAAAGGYAGNKIQEGMQERNTHTESRNVCKTTVETLEEPDGFDVTYRTTDGQERVVRMDHDPGDRVALEDGQPVLNR